MSALLADTCRLCLHTSAITDIFDSRGGVSLSVKASTCLGIKVQKGDRLPTLICEMCEKNLNNFYEFRLKCHAIGRRLEGMERQHSTCCELKQKCPNTPLDIKPELDEHILIEVNQLPNQPEPISGCNAIKQETCDNDYGESLHPAIADEIKFASDNVYSSKTEHLADSNSLSHETLFARHKAKDEDSIEIANHKVKKSRKAMKRATPSVQCELCGKIFKYKAILKKHLSAHSGVKQFACALCGKRFTRAEHERVHMRAHRGQRPFVCDICARAFTKRQDLLRHMRIHSDEKKYPCPRCERRFKRAGDVSSHLRSHTGARPFACGACDAAYSSHSGLKKHLRTHCVGAKPRKTATDSHATT